MIVINDAPGDDYCEFCSKYYEICTCLRYDEICKSFAAIKPITWGTGCTVPESCHPFFYDDLD